MPRPRYKTEKEICHQAFEIYFALGLKRSYQRVADELGVSKSTIKNWGNAFRWQDRIEERTGNQKPPSGLIESGLLSSPSRLLKIIEAAEALLIQQLSEGRTKPTIGELIRLIGARMALDDISETGDPNKQVARMVIYDPHK